MFDFKSIKSAAEVVLCRAFFRYNMHGGHSDGAGNLLQQMGEAEELIYGSLPDNKAIDPDRIKLKKGEILVQVHAISINPIDWKILSGSQRLVASSRFPGSLEPIFQEQFIGPEPL